MKKFILTIGIIFLLIGVSINPSTGISIKKKSIMQKSDGNTLYVGGNGSGGHGLWRGELICCRECIVGRGYGMEVGRAFSFFPDVLKKNEESMAWSLSVELLSRTLMIRHRAEFSSSAAAYLDASMACSGRPENSPPSADETVQGARPPLRQESSKICCNAPPENRPQC